MPDALPAAAVAGRKAAVRTVVLAVSLVLPCGGCTEPPSAARKGVLRVATGVAEQDSYSVGTALVASFARALPGLRVDHVQAQGSSASISLVEEGRADFALAGAETVYTAYARNATPDDPAGREISGVAVLYPSVLHVVTSDRTGVSTLQGLRGRRIAVGSFHGARTEMVVRIVLSRAGLSFEDIEPVWLARTEMARALDAGTIDAACHYGGFAVLDVTGRFRPIPIGREIAGDIQAEYPFVRPAVVPSGTYRGQESVVASVSIDMLLVARRDVGDRLVYDVVNVVSEALPSLARTHQVLRTVEPRNMPTPPIPLHPGAARFYREQALLR